MTNGAVQSSYLRSSYGLSCKYAFFLSLQTLSRLPVMCITLWFNAFSIKKVILFSATFVERISRLGEEVLGYFFVCFLTYISPSDLKEGNRAFQENPVLQEVETVIL